MENKSEFSDENFLFIFSDFIGKGFSPIQDMFVTKERGISVEGNNNTALINQISLFDTALIIKKIPKVSIQNTKIYMHI